MGMDEGEGELWGDEEGGLVGGVVGGISKWGGGGGLLCVSAGNSLELKIEE